MEQTITNPNFLKDVESIQKNLVNMAGSVLQAHISALEAFESKSGDIFENVALRLKDMEHLANEVDNITVKTLALYGAGGIYIRFLIAGMKIANDLVGIGNDIKKYAKSTRDLMDNDLSELAKYKEYIVNLHKCTIRSLNYSLDAIRTAFEKINMDNYMLAKIEESKTDDLHSLLEKEILSLMYKEGDKTQMYIKVLKNIKKIERSADRAVDICSLVLYCKEGGSINSY